jgi:hypothetical protein
MPCQILVSYQSSKPVGEVVDVVADSHQFSASEQLTAGSGEWTRLFTVIIIRDKTAAELLYLKSPLLLAGTTKPTLHPSNLGSWYFGVPPLGTPEYTALNATGEIECDWATAAKFLLERS